MKLLLRGLPVQARTETDSLRRESAIEYGRLLRRADGDYTFPMFV